MCRTARSLATPNQQFLAWYAIIFQSFAI
jgi:cellulose 1,4-beta-cellobiosidase